MKTQPKISVVIPAYNEAESIDVCLEALRQQTVKPLEIIVVDNNSTDDTAKIAKNFEGVKVIVETDQGIIPARNRGFNSAKGDIIARVDADSKPEKDWIEQIINSFVEADIQAVTGTLYYYDMPLHKVSEKIDHTIRSGLQQGLKKLPFLAGANMAIRRETWESIAKETCNVPGIHDDIDLALHLTERDMTIGYNADMLVGTSLRRVEDPPAKFYRYVQLWAATYRHHGLNPSVTMVPAAIFLAGYPPLKLIRFFYDGDSNRFSLSKLKNEIDRLFKQQSDDKNL